jgi:2-polyprenyl-3-methyl-5-hydroxy-6-metoxy-1,4-benzoquinol methylase
MLQIDKCIICDGDNFIHLFQCKDYLLTQEMFSVFQCKSCGFRFTNPRPENKKLPDYYKSENYISHSENPKNLIDKIYNIVRNYTLKQKYKLVNKYHSQSELISPALNILDIGCGTAEFLKLFKQNKWQVYGIEPNESARDIAQTRNGIVTFNENYINEFSDNQFNVITLWHVLEHVPDIKSLITDIKRIINKKGILIIAIPNSDSLDARIYKQYWAAYDVPRHLYHFNKTSIKTLFDKYNFEIIEIIPMKFDAYYISLLSEKNKSGKSNLLRASINGLKSNLYAGKDNNYSSLIFVLKNKILI